MGFPPVIHTMSPKPNPTGASTAYLAMCCTNPHCHPFLLRVERAFLLFSVLLTQSQHICLKQRMTERLNFNTFLFTHWHTPYSHLSCQSQQCSIHWVAEDGPAPLHLGTVADTPHLHRGYRRERLHNHGVLSHTVQLLSSDTHNPHCGDTVIHLDTSMCLWYVCLCVHICWYMCICVCT